ncbi:YbaB/EbfC family nucleoid-associated protein [candidate division WWE3 bacterium]|uniref:YbaB/EbfC family nucleoid-associated protein n=1 Tax=candidate division WWE3 bacterium TaxID=2053526 RepID=A0A955LXC0_UNCKA|nr:YbaB/EbfC family nucleoid-associated protein [candidate division WWE3 bacterium]
MFDKIKQLNELRSNYKQLQKELEAEILEVNHKGVDVKLNGNMDILELKSNDKDDETIVKAINEASKQMKKVLEKKMRGRMGDLGFGL